MHKRRRTIGPVENDTQRIEAFSDGVFAIAITLLVLEIRVPELSRASSPGRLASELLRLWPSYFAYVFSFVMVGIYWANHHYIFRLYQRTNHVFNLLNVLFLMCISFLPFPTAVLARYATDPHARHSAVTFYTLGLFLAAVSWSLLWWYGSWGYRLIDKRLEPTFVAFLSRQYLISPVVYLLAFLVSLASATWGLALCVGLSLLYLLPPKAPVYRA